MLSQARQILQKYFGYPNFREGQKKIVSRILDRKDTLGVMPTGGGKSICYQIPAIIFPGVTLVISPLISLMKDQIDTLQGVGVPATFINSTISHTEVQRRIERTRNGEIKLLYVAPERFDSPSFRHLFENLNLSLIAIDEAHCMSQWGHDFRPSYRSIGTYIKELPIRPVLSAFTATATPEVIQDICAILGMDHTGVFVSGFGRPNLAFSVVRGTNKRDFVTNYLDMNRDVAGIIYASTRKEVDQLYQFLTQKGYSVGRYHAGLTEEERLQTQEKFLYDDIQIIVATNAFGMGIDKSNVRYVLHNNLPKNIESYYQEAGRAGRDGESSECILLFQPKDIHVQKFLIEQNTSPERQAHEYGKLQSMVDYCYAQQCLQQSIRNYFGEETQETCGQCDNCKNEYEQTDLTEEAQMIFSCVKRMNERFGVSLVAKVLKGSKDQKVQQFGFEKLPTYGLMHRYSIKEITEQINVLIAEGYLRMTDGQYPTVQLTESSIPVLKGTEKVWMRKLKKKRSAVTHHNELFERLRQLRKEIAQRDKVPPYIVFADSTLHELSQQCPVDKPSMLQISGVGRKKLDQYGDEFVRVIQEYLEARE